MGSVCSFCSKIGLEPSSVLTHLSTSVCHGVDVLIGRLYLRVFLQRSSQLPSLNSLLQRFCWCSSKAVCLVILHRDVGVSTEEMSRTSLIADDSESVTTKEQRQEWELPCDCWGDLGERRDPIKLLRTAYHSFDIAGTQIKLVVSFSCSGINMDTYSSSCRTRNYSDNKKMHARKKQFKTDIFLSEEFCNVCLTCPGLLATE